MKKLAIIAIMQLMAVLGMAETPESFLVDADITLRYYEDRMPGIIEEGEEFSGVRVYYSAEATVEFCRTVDESQFFLDVVEVDGMNQVSLRGDGLMFDCMGPTRKQTLRYRLDDSVDTNLPFAQLKPVSIFFDGVVY